MARRGTALLGSLLSSGESSDVIQHVLTQLLDSAKRSGGYGDRGKCPITKKYASPHSQLQTLVLTLSRVCSTWDDAVCTLLHGGAAICLQPRELRVVKCKAHAIDLTGMHDEFVRELEEKLGGYRVSVPSGYDEEDDDVELEQLPFLQTLYDDIFGGTGRRLAASYIEELAKPLNPKEANELGLLGKSPFVVRCQPTRILDLMWHVHMTFPRKYSAACTDLIGAVIDHNPGYRNPEGEGSSKLVEKLDAVYATERLFAKDYSHDLGWMISSRTIQEFCFELEEFHAEAFFDEPGCG